MYAIHIGSLNLRGPEMCTSEHVQFMGMTRVQGSLSPANIIHSHKAYKNQPRLGLGHIWSNSSMKLNNK